MKHLLFLLLALSFMIKAADIKSKPESEIPTQSTDSQYPYVNKIIRMDNQKKTLQAPISDTYQWYKDNKALEGETRKTLSVSEGGNYMVKMADEMGNISKSSIGVGVTATGVIIKIYLIGDSTVATFAPGAYPLAGWGQVLPHFFDSSNIQIINKAVPGMSTKTFYTNYWTPIKNVLAKGDYVFIQFGHNDLKYKITIAAYQQYLATYVSEIKAKGGIPVFVTSMNKNIWTGATFTGASSIGAYPDAMRQSATTLQVPLIDLNTKSAALFSSLGKDYATWCIFNYLPADGTYPNYPNGNSDATHFQESGAIEMAKLVIQGIKELTSDSNMKALVPFLKPLYEVAIKANPGTFARVVTHTASYPAGITVTLRTVPKTGKVFLNWNNAANNQVSAKQIYWFTMGAAKTSYTALYSGYTLREIEEEAIAEAYILSPNPFQNTFHVSVLGKFDYILYDMAGTEIEKGTAENKTIIGAKLKTGPYLLKIQNIQGTKLIRVIKD